MEKKDEFSWREVKESWKGMKPIERQIVEIVIVGVLMGVFMVVLVDTVMEKECVCYDNNGQEYHTTWITLKGKDCEKQCEYFSEQAETNLTDKKPLYASLNPTK